MRTEREKHGNPHRHRLLYSERLSKGMEKCRSEYKRDIDEVREDYRTTLVDFSEEITIDFLADFLHFYRLPVFLHGRS